MATDHLNFAAPFVPGRGFPQLDDKHISPRATSFTRKKIKYARMYMQILLQVDDYVLVRDRMKGRLPKAPHYVSKWGGEEYNLQKSKTGTGSPILFARYFRYVIYIYAAYGGLAEGCRKFCKAVGGRLRGMKYDKKDNEF